ncbi:MAG: hypothetical protein KME17_14105 [Cyanosarcina radialis HA8281-LM2]|nr:hypothetical protein [Cyanosarcina radialis HA8281-LM2]
MSSVGGRWGDEEQGRQGRWGDEEQGRQGRWGDGEMGRARGREGERARGKPY